MRKKSNNTDKDITSTDSQCLAVGISSSLLLHDEEGDCGDNNTVHL